MSLKVKCAERKITGYFHNMSPRWINGRQTVFCIKKNVWDTMWPFFKAKETMLCSHFNETCCTNTTCAQKAVHDEYIRLKNNLQNIQQQKEK